MIKDILILMAEGKLTLNEISSKLEIRHSDLLNRLELMEHMGFIESISVEKCLNGSNPSCSCCPMPDTEKCLVDNPTKSKFNAYKITKKGEKIIQN